MSNENKFVTNVDEVRKTSLIEEGDSYYRAKRYEEALGAYKKAIQLDSSNAAAYVGKGNSLRKLEKFWEALDAYEEAIAFEPNNVFAYNGKCFLYIKLKYYEDAMRAHKRVIELDPENATAYNGKGQILRCMGQYEHGLQAFEKAIKLAKDEDNLAGFYYNKGLTLCDLDRDEEALEAYENATLLDPEKTKYIDEKEKIICKLRLNILPYSRHQIDTSKQTDSITKYLEEGEKFQQLHLFEQALQMFDKVLRSDHKNILALLRKGNTLLELERYKEGHLSFDRLIQVQPSHALAYVGKGSALLKLRDYSDALDSFSKALKLNPKLVQAHAGRGHVFFKLHRFIDALKTYEEAVNLHSDDIRCYSNLGDILTDLQSYEKAAKAYEGALQLDPQLISAHLGLGNALFKLEQYEEALAIFKQAIRIDKKNIAAYLRMGDIRTVLQQYEYAIDAYEIALRLAGDELNPDILWLLAYTLQTPYRPAYVQFELFQHFLVHTPSDSRTNVAFECIGNLYDRLFGANTIPSDRFRANIQVLQNLLLHLPGEERSEALTLIANGDDIRIARLLIQLAPFSLSGLTTLAHQVTLRWFPTPRNDDLVVRFYDVLDSYGVPYEDSNWLYAQELMLEGRYIQAKTMLSDLVRQRLAPDPLWSLATALWQCKEPFPDQIKVLHQFIASTVPSDIRCGEAWKRIGEFSIENDDDGIAAIEAYKKAEQYGLHIPQLQGFRNGDWDAIPALRHHPDYVFPPVVVIDLESDYQPDAPLGSCVFEVGAVRVKGGTELDTYQAIIQRDRVSPKIAHRQGEAKPLELVVNELQAFIEKSQQSMECAIIVGHNLQAFDALHLRAMGIPISNDQIIDTLTFARLLYPDSLHHNLELLCNVHGITFQGEAHTALPDAQACARLLHALGEELVQRGEKLFAGFRAFVSPGSAFDRTVLQPRSIAAVPGFSWVLDSAPTVSHILASINDRKASPGILKAFATKTDALIERYDPNAAYVKDFPVQQRSIVTVHTRTRLERILAASQKRTDLFVLPDPRTLLCPHRLRKYIEREESQEIQLRLFCLYQASHNHDARTLYPLRFSTDDSTLNYVKKILLEACCASDWNHADSCSALVEAKKAIDTSTLLLATHESFLHQNYQPKGDLIVVDDADELQMHFAEYLAERITSEQLSSWSADVCKLFEVQISTYANEYISNPAFHERLPLHNIVPYLTQPQNGSNKNMLTGLREIDSIGEAIADKLENFCQTSLQETATLRQTHAYWLDLQFNHEQPEVNPILEKWCFCGLNRDLRQAFQELFWQPYHQHIICGTAIRLGKLEDKFLKRFFGLPKDIEFFADKRPSTKVYIPTSGVIRPSSFLGRRPWAESAGAFLYKLISSSHQSVVVTLHSSLITEALTNTFKTQEAHLKHQVLSPQLGWATAKIAERLTSGRHSTLTIISPHLRKAVLDSPVDVEVSGPLRFLNQRDPVITAQIRAFTELDSNEGPFSAYLLPQALLELKARISSQADMHIILDSALRDAVYRDEVFALFQEGELCETLQGIQEVTQDIPNSFTTKLATELERLGLDIHSNISDKDLLLTLQTFWRTDTFRESPLNQKEVIGDVFAGKDQLVVAATGGGKSLCFQLPAILLAQDVIPRVTLVISPLIALMHDQITSLRHNGVFSAIVLDSMLSDIEREAYLRGIQSGDYSIVYIAPEQIHSSRLYRALARRQIGLIAIDEAHCVSQWGHNFRTDYFALKKWIDVQICEGRKRPFPLLALTATARKGYSDPATGYQEIGTIEDIIDKLGLRLSSEEVKLTSPERPELVFRVERILLPCPNPNCHQRLKMKKSNMKCPMCGKAFSFPKKQFKEMVRQAKVETLVSLLTRSGEAGLRHRWELPYGQRQRGIVYCRTVKETKKLVADIRKSIPELRIDLYNGSMVGEDRKSIYQRFMSDGEDGLDIVVATNAFGMGIDARRLGFVIHFDVPATLEAYYQEAGRAGRDPEFRSGKDRAQCILLYHDKDLEDQRWLISRDRITEQDIEAVYEALCKLRSAGEQEILVTKEDIGLLSGVDPGKVATCLYYLEYHTRARGAPILERRENAAKLWQLKFEQGYRERIVNPALSSLSKQLIEVFCSSIEFRLNEEQTVIIDREDLATHLQDQMSTIEEGVKNLVKRHIVAFASSEYVKWKKSKAESCEVIKQVVRDIINVLNNVEDRDAFQNGKVAFVNLQSLYEESKLSSVSQQALTPFLSLLAQTDSGDLQLFAAFHRSTKHSQQGCYQLRLKSELQLNPRKKVRDIISGMRKQLCQVAEQFGDDTITDEWQYIDLLKEAPDSQERRRLKLLLEWLKILGLLEWQEQKRNVVFRVRFEQDTVPLTDLKINLSSLRLVERYGEKKLELMKKYAILPEEQRATLLNAYFFGEIPLIEPFVMRADLTKQQRKIVALTEGYHLVEGPAGSGKTTILLEHIRYLVERKLVPVDRILVATHFNSATNRISNNLVNLQQNEKTIYVKTLNTLGENIFRRYQQFLKHFDGKPYYTDSIVPRLLKSGWMKVEEEELSLVQDVLSRMQLGEYVYEPWPSDLEKPRLQGVYPLDAKRCLTAIRLFREYGIFPTCKHSSEDISLALKGMKPQGDNISLYYAVYINYLLLLREKGLYTYDDQILFALAILDTHSDIATRYQHRYEHIIIDEFQDLTPAETKLIGLLSSRYQNVVAFGDQMQDIRGKETRSFLGSMRTDPLVRSFECLGNDIPIQSHYLTTNFRSVQEILDLANDLRSNEINKAQKAARGSRGEKPALIRVQTSNIIPSSAKTSDYISNELLYTLVNAALYHKSLLPDSDTGSVAFMVAKSAWSSRVQRYLREERRCSFSVLDNAHQYQSYHVDRVLTYFRLIIDNNLDDDVEHLLRRNLVPAFSSEQIKKLKELAKNKGQSLIDVVLDKDILKQLNIAEEQEGILQQHLGILNNFCSDSLFSDVWQAISELEYGPIVGVVDQEQEAQELEDVLRELGNYTVKQALERIDSHISFLEEHRANRELVVTTIDNAKSQAFDTVFLLGADFLNSRERWYVSVTRARQRFFCLANKKPEVLSSIPKEHFDELEWP